jgi:hypothetical protein
MYPHNRLYAIISPSLTFASTNEMKKPQTMICGMLCYEQLKIFSDILLPRFFDFINL